MATLATTMPLRRQEPSRSETEMIGSSLGMRRALKAVSMVASTDSAVLIQGETGTGKELIARSVHDQSSRRHEPFVTLNCAAIPSGLMESELFGHERGAYTGALNSAVGRFQLAHQGTLFLDEIGDMPLELQPKLLRVLQEQEFERLGSTRTIQVDVRIVAATNRDLFKMVQERRFRADLFYRLHVFPIELPPLRERVDDIPLLVRHFVRKFASRMNREIHSIPENVIEALQQHSWPGNIRELQNFIERAVILSSGPVLAAPLGDLKGFTEARTPSSGLTLADAEREDEWRRQSALSERLTDLIIQGVPGAFQTGAKAPLRLPNFSTLCFPGVEGELLLLRLDRLSVFASAGSACTSGSLAPSHVLLAMGFDPAVAGAHLRLTLGRSTTLEQVELAARAVMNSVAALRGSRPRPRTASRRVARHEDRARTRTASCPGRARG